MSKKAVVTDYEYPDIECERSIVTGAGFEFADFQVKNGSALANATRDADVVIVQYADITSDIIAGMKHCMAIIKYGIGINNIDVDAATRRGIHVCNVPDYGLDEVSNHAVAMLLALARKLPVAEKSLRSGAWGPAALKPIKRLSECTLGLVGFGALGKIVAGKMAGFGVETIVFDPYLDTTAAEKLGATVVGIDELCRRSDMISIHCPLTPDTRHLFNAERLAMMKPTASLVNTSRGPIIDEQALVEALKKGCIAGAGLDVFEAEPLPRESGLLALDNVILTSHVAWYSEESIALLQRKAAEEAVNILGGNKPLHACNKF